MTDKTKTTAPAQDASAETSAAEGNGAKARFNTFSGVFTPCTLTILGVIMFMRSGYIVGAGGLISAIIILLMAKLITGLTTLSLSAIATNTEVKTGGVYYMISRTLGHDFGGAIGLTLFVSQAISIAFYVIGFTESLFNLFPGELPQLVHQLTSCAVILLIFMVTFKGADLAIKAQYPILAVLLLSVLSFVIGGIQSFNSELVLVNATAPDVMPDADKDVPGFWLLFALFFPAATGITAGANMSGDLRNPAKSIPRGTLLSIFFTGLVYLVQLVLIAGFVEQSALIEEPISAYDQLKEMSIFSPLVIAGVFAATLSSALGSFLGAPRILQAIGKDRIFKSLAFFGKGQGSADEPRRATILSLGIALAVVWAGDLNVIAEVISMFFLIAYGMINLSAFVESRGGNPSFRPRFKRFGWPAALVGAIGCVVAMIKINESAAIVAILIASVIYLYLRGRKAEWGDAKRGYIFARVRDNLKWLEKSPMDSKNWRPIFAVITDDAEHDMQMVECVSWLESGRGMLSVLEVFHSLTTTDLPSRLSTAKKRQRSLALKLESYEIGGAFADSVVTDHGSSSLDTVLQSYSIGSLRPNTLVFSIPPSSDPTRRQHFIANLRTAAAFKQNILIYKGARLDMTRRRRRIDLWWHGQKNGSLMALLAYLTSLHPDWSKARVRLIRVVPSDSDHQEADKELKDLTYAARLEMDIEVIPSEQPISELIQEQSANSDLVFLGLAEHDIPNFEAFLAEREPTLSKLPPALLVLSNGEVDLLA